MARLPAVNPSEIVEPSWGNMVRNQTITPFANATERNAAIPTPTSGMVTYLVDVDAIEYYSASSVWKRLAAVAGGGQPSGAAWTRPANWLPTNVVDGEQKVQLLAAISTDVTTTVNRIVSIKISDDYTVNWGDGTAPENLGAGVQATHTYLPDGLTDLRPGWKQALITITPQAGKTIYSINLDQIIYSASHNNRSTLLEVVTGPSTILVFGGTAPYHGLLEHIEIKGDPTVTLGNFFIPGIPSMRSVSGSFRWNSSSISSLFRDCINLVQYPTITPLVNITNFQDLFFRNMSMTTPPTLNMANATNAAQMFFYCYSLPAVPSWVDTTKCTSTASMFDNCLRLVDATASTLNVVAGTNVTAMFRDCQSLREITISNTTAATNVSYMFSGCNSLEKINGQIDLSSVSSVANLAQLFQNCYRLRRLELVPTKGPRFSWTVANTNLDGPTLNAIYTALPTVTGQTITVTGAPGSLNDDPSIATAKGWTVTGS